MHMLLVCVGDANAAEHSAAAEAGERKNRRKNERASIR
jgi:hypothetical protein